MERRIKAAKFPTVKSLDGADTFFQPNLYQGVIVCVVQHNGTGNAAKFLAEPLGAVAVMQTRGAGVGNVVSRSSSKVRKVLYDNMRSLALERRSDAIRFHPTLLELAAHCRFEPPFAQRMAQDKTRA